MPYQRKLPRRRRAVMAERTVRRLRQSRPDVPARALETLERQLRGVVISPKSLDDYLDRIIAFQRHGEYKTIVLPKQPPQRGRR